MLRPPTLTALGVPSGTSFTSATLTKLDLDCVSGMVFLISQTLRPLSFLQRIAWLCSWPIRCPCSCECRLHSGPGPPAVGYARGVRRREQDLSLRRDAILQIPC